MPCLFFWSFSPASQAQFPAVPPPSPAAHDPANPLHLTAAEQAWIQKHPVVRWGVDPNWPPFSSFDEQGRGSGIDINIVELVARRAGLKLELVRTPTWTETFRRLIAGEIDFVSGIVRTEEREHIHGLRFTRDYSKFPTAIITRKDTPFLTSLSQLGNGRIALPKDYASTEKIERAYPNARFVITESEEESLLLVSSGDADATAINVAVASYLAHTSGLSDLKISGFTDLEFHLRLATRGDSPELQSILEKALATLDRKEEEKIDAKYILLETRREINWRTWRRRTIIAILLGALAVAGVMYWNRQLTREIRRREDAEEAMRRMRDDLAQHTRDLDRHTVDVEQLNARLTTVNKDLQAFSYSVSHDLRSPIRRLLSFVELLEEDAGPSLNEDARQHLRVIRQEAGRMSALITALLAFTRIGRAELHLAPVNLKQLAGDVSREAQAEARDRPIEWRIEDLPEMTCDATLIRQVFANLLDNAVKFTRDRKPARIEVGTLPSKPEDKEVVFFVRDNGSGFDPIAAPTLFQPFQRLHKQEEFEGTGLGLANVQRIIQKHGGRVWAEGNINKGATFYFTLPREIKQPAETV